jgi:hypothetical protein
MNSLFSVQPATLRSLFATALLLCAASAMAQAPSPRTNPDLRLKVAGEVHAIARHPDGGVVFGGNFTSVNGEPRGNLARLRNDGSLDPDWHPSADGSVQKMAVAPDGAVYVAGYFSEIDGQPRAGIAKLAGTGAGAVDPAWSAQLDHGSSVYAMVADAGGVYVGGAQFTVTTTPPVPRRLTKLSAATGNADPAWTVAPDVGQSNAILTLASDASGLYVGGSFDSIGGVARSNAAKLVRDAGGNVIVDANWNPAPDKFPYQFVLDGDAMYVVGLFDNIGGKARSEVAKIDTANGVAMGAWNAGTPNGEINTVAVDGNGDVYVGGSFSAIGASTRHRLAKLSSVDGSVAASWHPRFDGAWEGILVAATIDVPGPAGDMLVVGGPFTRAEDELRLGFASIEASGALGDRADAELPGAVMAVAAQSDGGLIVGGDFLTADGYPLHDLIRVRADGTLDTGWVAGIGDGVVNVLAVDSHDDVYAGGFFGDGPVRDHLVKLSGALGSRDPAWIAQPDSPVFALATDETDNVYIGGQFNRITAGAVTSPRNGVARFTPAGALDAWNPQPGSTVHAIAVDGRDAVYLGGPFLLGKFAVTDGARDPNWNPAPANSVMALAVDADGNVYAGGDFPMIGGAGRFGLAKLLDTGAADAVWNPASEAGTVVTALMLDGNGRLYAGGDFSELGGGAHANLARLSTANAGLSDAPWNPSPDNDVLSLALTADGAVAVAGRFTQIGGEARDAMAVLDARLTQVITFGPNPGRFVFGGAAGAASATASSGLAVRYGSATPEVCAVDAASGMISIVGAGDCIVTADQAGDASYDAAPQATQTVGIDKADQAALIVTVTPAELLPGRTAAVSATGGTTAQTIVYRVAAGNVVCEVSGTAVNALEIGTCTIEARRPGDRNYNDVIGTTQLRVSAVAGAHVFGDGFER